MQSPPTIEKEILVAAISSEAPTGSNIRESSASALYFQLKDARSAARAAERRADTEGEQLGLLPEWRTILSLAPKVLAERSKDLEIVAWLIEALVRRDGFAGLRDGLAVAADLVDQYWDTLFSLEDEDGVATKVAPIAGLNGLDAEGTLIQPLRKIPLTAAGEDGPFAAYHYEQAWALGQISDPAQRARREEGGAISLDRFMAAANASGGAFYLTLIDDIEASIAALDALGTALDARAGKDSPPTSSIRNVLVSILETVQRFSHDLVARVRPAAGADASAPLPNGAGGAHMVAGSNGAAGASVAVSGGALHNREDALRLLLQVADYFRRNEPHSPISTSLEELVRRGRMPFPDLLAELLQNPDAWRTAMMSAGIKPPATDN